MGQTTVSHTTLDTAVFDSLADTGFCEIPDFIAPMLVQQLVHEMRQLDEQQQFHSASIGRADAQRVNTQVRGDRIFWLEPSLPIGGLFLAAMEDVQHQLNRELFLGLAEFEAHYAIYPAGAFYKRHLDRHRDQPARTISAVLYLNAHWPADAGGELVAELQNGEPRKVIPEAGKLVLFRSDTIHHEVLATRQERMSLTGWFRRSL